MAANAAHAKQDVVEQSYQLTARRREALWGYLMIAPLVLGLAIFFYFGLGASAVISFTKWDILTPMQWVGLDNYVKLFNSASFWKTLFNTLRYTVIGVPIGWLYRWR